MIPAVLLAAALVLGLAFWAIRRRRAGLAAQLDKAHRARAEAERQAADGRAWLEGVLLHLPEGVVVCDSSDRILHASPAAARLLGGAPPGRPLSQMIGREPLAHARELLALHQGAGTPPFLCTARETLTLLQGRLAPLHDAAGETAGYVALLADAGRTMAAAAEDNRLRRALTRDLRAPLASLRAAAETLAAYPDMGAPDRAGFDAVIREECATLAQRLTTLEARFEAARRARGLDADIHSFDLINGLARRLAAGSIRLTPVGLPLWLHGDGQSLLPALTHLLRETAILTRERSFDAEAQQIGQRIYLDFAWPGKPLPVARLEQWLDTPLEDAAGQTARDILERHDSEPWSMPGRTGGALLRIPLPAPAEPQSSAASLPPPRPEHPDRALLARYAQPGRAAGRPLSQLSCVAFDVETTGLDPAADRVVAIAAVRVVSRRILVGETFDRVIDPGRPIPAESTRYHGLTDAAVAGKPEAAVVLPQFAAFAGDAVLVAHDAAFDLAFLDAAAMANPVLDTLLLAAATLPGPDLSLGGLARRLGLPPPRRRAALDDALLCAEILVRLLDLLDARGIRTLEDALALQAAMATARETT